MASNARGPMKQPDMIHMVPSQNQLMDKNADKVNSGGQNKSPEKKKNQLRQQLNQKGFQIELASSVGSLLPDQRGHTDP